MTESPTAGPIPAASKQQSYFVGYLIDALAPTAAYFILHGLGISPTVSLILGSVIAIASTVFNTIRSKRLDKFGVLVIVEIAASIALLFATHDPRFLLIKPSIYTGIAAGFLIFSAFGARPASLEGAKPIATKGDPAKTAAYEAAWEQSREFRAAHRMSTFGWGVIFLVDSITRVVVVYTSSIARAAWLSSLPHIACIIVLIVFSALMGRKFERILKPVMPAKEPRKG